MIIILALLGPIFFLQSLKITQKNDISFLYLSVKKKLEKTKHKICSGQAIVVWNLFGVWHSHAVSSVAQGSSGLSILSNLMHTFSWKFSQNVSWTKANLAWVENRRGWRKKSACSNLFPRWFEMFWNKIMAFLMNVPISGLLVNQSFN